MDLPPVAIPSYKRVSTLAHKTLKFLLASHYPPAKITVFVADEEEYKAYRVMIRAICPLVNLVIGRPTLSAQRKYIADYYPEHQPLLCCDDDVSGIKFLDEDADLLGLVRYGVKMLEEHKSGLFSVLPNDDGRRMRYDLTTNLTHSIGAFFLCINRRNLVPVLQEKEDYERSILYFKAYGTVLRYRGAGVNTQYMADGGGLNTQNRKARMAADSLLLKQMFPKAVSLVTKKDLPDIRLNWRATVDELGEQVSE